MAAGLSLTLPREGSSGSGKVPIGSKYCGGSEGERARVRLRTLEGLVCGWIVLA